MLVNGIFRNEEHSFYSLAALINDYLINRRQRVKVNGSFSPWKYLTSGVLQGLALGSLLLSICINDISLLLFKAQISAVIQIKTVSILAIRR